jgi:hypothetical protein
MNRPDLTSEAQVADFRGTRGLLDRVIVSALPGQVMRVLLAARGSRSPPAERRPR